MTDKTKTFKTLEQLRIDYLAAVDVAFGCSNTYNRDALLTNADIDYSAARDALAFIEINRNEDALTAARTAFDYIKLKEERLKENKND